MVNVDVRAESPIAIAQEQEDGAVGTGDRKVQLAVAVKVTNSHDASPKADRVRGASLKGAVAVAQKNANGIAVAIQNRQIELAVTREIGGEDGNGYRSQNNGGTRGLHEIGRAFRVNSRDRLGGRGCQSRGKHSHATRQRAVARKSGEMVAAANMDRAAVACSDVVELVARPSP